MKEAEQDVRGCRLKGIKGAEAFHRISVIPFFSNVTDTDRRIHFPHKCAKLNGIPIKDVFIIQIKREYNDS